MRKITSMLTGAVAPLGLLVGLACGTGAHALEINLPTETATYQPSSLPGYQLAQTQCLICHSAQYVRYQPPNMPPSFWEALVKKMKATYGAPLPDEDIAPIAEYLSKTYGAESTAAK